MIAKIFSLCGIFHSMSLSFPYHTECSKPVSDQESSGATEAASNERPSKLLLTEKRC